MHPIFFPERAVSLPIIGDNELVQRRVIAKDDGQRPDNIVISVATEFREQEIIPWEWIEDETRSLSNFVGHASVLEAALNSLRYARLDAWRDRPPMILTESRSLAGVLYPVVAEYAARIASTNGPCAGFLHTKLAPALREGDQVLYLGDADFSGGHIEANTKNVLRNLLRARKVGWLNWQRLAVTDEQIAEYDLTVIQKWDDRTKSRHPAVETEALGQARIVEIVRSRLEELLPEPLADVLPPSGMKSSPKFHDVEKAIEPNVYHPRYV